MTDRIIILIAFRVTTASRLKMMMMVRMVLEVMVIRIVYWSISASCLYVHLIDSRRGRIRRGRHDRRERVVDFAMVVAYVVAWWEKRFVMILILI